MHGENTMSSRLTGQSVLRLAREAILSGDHAPLINYQALGRDALLPYT